MASRIFDHVDLRVSDVAQARKFYDVFLPALGFANIRPCAQATCYYHAGDPKNSPFVELNELPGHRGNANRVAFWMDTEEEVNRLGEIIRQAGAPVVEGPEYCPDYTPGYYAVFFEDDDGNKWEIWVVVQFEITFPKVPPLGREVRRPSATGWRGSQERISLPCDRGEHHRRCDCTK